MELALALLLMILAFPAMGELMGVVVRMMAMERMMAMSLMAMNLRQAVFLPELVVAPLQLGLRYTQALSSGALTSADRGWE
jgi:hypothetical protein